MKTNKVDENEELKQEKNNSKKISEVEKLKR